MCSDASDDCVDAAVTTTRSAGIVASCHYFDVFDTVVKVNVLHLTALVEAPMDFSTAQSSAIRPRVLEPGKGHDASPFRVAARTDELPVTSTAA